jgi:hypothetical protein
VAYTTLGEGLVHIQDAGLNTLVVDDLPTEVSFRIALQIASGPDDVGAEFAIPLDLHGPDGQLPYDFDYPIAIGPAPAGHPPRLLLTEFREIEVVFDADTEGIHELDIRDPTVRRTHHQIR